MVIFSFHMCGFVTYSNITRLVFVFFCIIHDAVLQFTSYKLTLFLCLFRRPLDIK